MDRLNDILSQVILKINDYELTVLNVVLIFAVVLAVWILRWAVGQAMMSIYENFKISKESKIKIKRFLNSLIIFFASILLIRSLGINPVDDILNIELFKMPFGKDDEDAFKIANIFYVFLIYVVVRVVMWIIDQLLGSYYERDRTDVGVRYAINQIIRYIIYTIALLSVIDVLGFDLTLIWGGAAALLVGFGLGLQHTFNDLVSGLILLVERTVEVGDTLEVDGTIGVVTRIGIRVSHIKTRDDVDVIVPNSSLVTSKVINWTHNNANTRFNIGIGVAYGSDTQLVKRLLLEAVNQHEKVETYPTPFVQFREFGASSLDFKVYFWSKEAMEIEMIKSDLRFTIDSSFRENKVEVPFQQVDIWFRNKMG